MKFEGTELQLHPSIIEEDNLLREHFKLMLNSSIGKFAQQTPPTTTKFVQTQVRR